jgi:valyl-tRNA synthetase
MEDYDYAAAKSELEVFFWSELADNYLEMCKQRLYGEAGPENDAARYCLSRLLLTTLQLFAPFLPHVTEEIYQGLFAQRASGDSQLDSIHASPWPLPDPALEDDQAEALGATMVGIATAVRRYKSQNGLPLGTQLGHLQLATNDPQLADSLRGAGSDLKSITRAIILDVGDETGGDYETIDTIGKVSIRVGRLSDLNV